MLEQTRLDYLQAMGITQWMPREPLPHAPAPRWLPPVAANHHSHAEVEQFAQSHHIPPVMAAELLAVGDAATKVAEKLAASQPATQPVAEESVVTELPVANSAPTDLTPPRFELHFLRIGQRGLWVCSDAQQLDSMMRFAHRVMMGMRQPIEIMQAPLCFRWPFIESSHQDQGRAVAQQALSAQWQHFAGQGVQYLIAFGDAAQEWLPQCGAQLSFVAADTQSVMQSASEKRRLWQVLLAQDGQL
ncbi:MAG: hypothetical protein MK185_11150 [Saccharospirillaceae bacterium]|nr:hypothetical protein [Saccharospirillaceae bacterium]